MLILLMGIHANAQTFVSTSVEDKNVVLEEFTGIYCTFCPDGHRLAQELKDADPDDIVLINIHVGGYADPNPGDPDFRTPYGTAIMSQSSLSGYPVSGYIVSKSINYLSKNLTNNVFFIFYSGRIANFVFCMIVCWLTIKTIPKGKNYLFTIFSPYL